MSDKKNARDAGKREAPAEQAIIGDSLGFAATEA